MTRAELLKVLERHNAALAEHCDAVEILCSRILPDGSTENYHLGTGNWYARAGLTAEHHIRCQREMFLCLSGAGDPRDLADPDEEQSV